MSCTNAGFVFDNTFATQLDGLFVPWEAGGFPNPTLVKLNAALATELGLDLEALTASGAAMFSGNALPAGSHPLAQVYAGHQFGGFSPQLGDGRALLIGEVIDIHGRRRDVQLKGSGPTPFSRGGDGKAALGPVLREYVLGEAMHALGIPTTRALAVVTTGEMVHREQALPGAVLTRVAASHIRVGTFEFFAARDEQARLRKLADYTLARHYPEEADAANPYDALLRRVGLAQAKLVAQWMHVGFIHGVMNTDNVAISGETIDYGPCAFMDTYHPATVFSSIDRSGRYAYGNQPAIAKWNLARFAEALLPLLDDDADAATALAHAALDAFTDAYQEAWLDGMRRKLGLAQVQDGDLNLVEELLGLFEEHKVDYTSTMRALSNVVRGSDDPALHQLGTPAEFDPWRVRWEQRLDSEAADRDTIAARMDAINPVVVPRNHMVEAALAAAVDDHDLGPLDALLEAVSDPFAAHPDRAAFAAPAPPDFGPYRTFCGT